MRFLVLLVLAVSCNSGGDTYTLYRGSGLDPALRVHLATFNANESGTYNQENCNMMMDMYNERNQGNPKAWCEKGEFKK